MFAMYAWPGSLSVVSASGRAPRELIPASTYLFGLGSLLLGRGIRIELEGSRTACASMIHHGLLGVLRLDGAVGVPGSFQDALRLELLSPAGGALEHAGGGYLVQRGRCGGGVVRAGSSWRLPASS